MKASRLRSGENAGAVSNGASEPAVVSRRGGPPSSGTSQMPNGSFSVNLPETAICVESALHDTVVSSRRIGKVMSAIFCSTPPPSAGMTIALAC